jgi:hypothetical protein
MMKNIQKMKEARVLPDHLDIIRGAYTEFANRNPEVQLKVEIFIDSIEEAWDRSGLCDYWIDVEADGVNAEKIMFL